MWISPTTYCVGLLNNTLEHDSSSSLNFLSGPPPRGDGLYSCYYYCWTPSEQTKVVGGSFPKTYLSYT